jgi:hypothetical protein
MTMPGTAGKSVIVEGKGEIGKKGNIILIHRMANGIYQAGHGVLLRFRGRFIT